MSNFIVIGIGSDHNLICEDITTGEKYNCGESLAEFGKDNLTLQEQKNLGLS